MSMNRFIGKKILAYGANKSRLGCYGNIGVIQNIDKNKVYIYYDKNPENYQNYEIYLHDFLRFIENGLYKLK